jgi:hypothetical protein
LSIVAFPVSKRAVCQSAGSPDTSFALILLTIGEFPEGSSGTGMKKVTFVSSESFVTLNEYAYVPENEEWYLSIRNLSQEINSDKTCKDKDKPAKGNFDNSVHPMKPPSTLTSLKTLIEFSR